MSQELANSLRDRQALTELERTEGWAVFCARFDKYVADLTATALDVNTPATDAEFLRQVRAKLISEAHPKTLLANTLKKIEATAKREIAPQQFHPETP